MAKQSAAALRAEADRIEAAETKAARLADAARIPTCPHCGGRSFQVYTWTLVGQSAEWPENPDDDDHATSYEWGDDYESGDHTDENQSATCNGCNADVQAVLEAFDWTFYDDPKPRPTAAPTRDDVAAAFALLNRYEGFGSASAELLNELETIFNAK